MQTLHGDGGRVAAKRLQAAAVPGSKVWLYTPLHRVERGSKKGDWLVISEGMYQGSAKRSEGEYRWIA